MSLGAKYWNARFSQWPTAKPVQQGYTVLVPVPGDLPVFLELALSVLALQDSEDRVEVLVIPDRMTPQMNAIVDRFAPRFSGDLRLVPLPQPERTILPKLRNPSHNHGIQILTGVSEARGSHVVLHDSDLFLIDRDALQKNYRATVDGNLLASGVSPVWDTWFADRDYNLVATWEMIARRDWLRSFPPHMHMGHDAEINGEAHTFDTTLHAQALSDQSRLALVAEPESFVHFNYVISTYRHFQRAKDGYEDDRFRLLLIRLFIDLFAQESFDYRMPSLEEMAAGVGSSSAPVTYPAPEADVREQYQDFRRKLDIIIDGPWSDGGDRDKMRAAVRSFDSYYGMDA